MTGMRRVRICAFAFAVQFTLALSAAAQLTTGSIAGTVKDAQGGVIPGATVTLVSESRGTRSVPVVTNDIGDFVFPEHHGRHLHHRSRDAVVQDAQAVRASRSTPAPQSSVGALTIEVGGATETVTVKGESPMIQSASGERSFTIPTASVQNLPLANRSFLAARDSWRPGVVMNGVQAQRLGSIVQSTTIMMDGVSTMDTGSNGAIVQMNVESIAEVKVLVRATRPNTADRAACRSPRSPRAAPTVSAARSITCGATPTGTPTARPTFSMAIPSRFSKQQEVGLLDRRPDRKTGRQQQAVFLLRAGVPATHRRQRCRDRSGCRPSWNGREIFRRRRDNLGNLYPYIRDPNLDRRRARRRTRRPASRTAACSGRIPANRLYQPGLNILKMWPMPNVAARRSGRNYEITRPPRASSAISRRSASTISRHQSLRVSVKYQGAIQRQQVFNGTIPGFNDSMMVAPAHRHRGGDGQLQPEPDDVSRRRPTGAPGTSWRAAARRRRFCNQTAVPTNRSRT